MTYAILDDKFHMNQKVLEAGNEAVGVYARALSYCGDQLTDGFLPMTWARSITTKKVIEKITGARLWRPVTVGEKFTVEAGDGTLVDITISTEGFYINDYLRLNPKRETVVQARDEIRRKRSEAGRKGAEARWQNGSFANGKHMANALANAWQTDGPQPQPQPQLLKDSLQLQQQPTQAPPSNPTEKLISALTDQTERTERTVRKIIHDNHLNESDIAWAHECATGPDVISPTRVAVAELKKRIKPKASA